MKQFLIVETSGMHFDVGEAIGKAMRRPIEDLLGQNKKRFATDLGRMLRESKKFLAQAQKYFPDYIEELRGIASGADVSFDELFLSNNREVADFNPRFLDPNHCTIIAIPSGESYILGHNEDWDADALSHLYILDATIAGTRIFGLNYANNLVGSSVAINGHGLIEAVNELSHSDAQIGVPKNFIARAILDCKTLDEAEHVVETTPRGAGYNHVLVQGDRLWNIETTAKEYAIEKVTGKKYIHTNHYLTELSRLDKGNAESMARYKKVEKLLPGISSVDDIKRVLSDREDPQICRSGTIGSFVFDPSNHVSHIAYGQPNPSTYYKMNF